MPTSQESKTSNAPVKPQRVGSVAAQMGISSSMIRAWGKAGLIRTSRKGGALRRVEKLNIAAIVRQAQKEGLLGSTHAQATSSGAPPVGARLRTLRLKRNDSLATVAAAVDISVGFLSNLERCQTSVSIAILHKLARYFGRNILDFFSFADSVGALVQSHERKILPGGRGVQMELLSWGKIIMEPHLFRVASGCGSQESYTHESEEFLYILSGRLAFTLGEQELTLAEGDSFYFESKISHKWHNPGKREALILWINTHPTF